MGRHAGLIQVIDLHVEVAGKASDGDLVVIVEFPVISDRNWDLDLVVRVQDIVLILVGVQSPAEQLEHLIRVVGFVGIADLLKVTVLAVSGMLTGNVRSDSIGVNEPRCRGGMNGLAMRWKS